MNKSPATRISGTRFIDANPSDQARVSMSASFRGMAHRITGENRSISTAIDAVEGEQALAVCAPATRQLAEDLFARWNDALKTLDPERVARCYAEDGILLPTVSNIPRTNHAEIADYFKHFLEKKPVGTVNQRNVRFGCNKITDAGIYTFRLTDKDGKVSDVPARYTFVYENRDGEWLIIHHHSSVMPS